MEAAWEWVKNAASIRIGKKVISALIFRPSCWNDVPKESALLTLSQMMKNTVVQLFILCHIAQNLHFAHPYVRVMYADSNFCPATNLLTQLHYRLEWRVKDPDKLGEGSSLLSLLLNHMPCIRPQSQRFVIHCVQTGQALIGNRKWRKVPWYSPCTRWCWSNEIAQQCLVAMFNRQYVWCFAIGLINKMERCYFKVWKISFNCQWSDV